MNYADEGTRFLDEANEAEVAAKWRSDELLRKAQKDTPARWPQAEHMELLIDIAHDALKEKDRHYKKHVGTNQWMLQKAMANFLAALVHNHEPSSKE